MGTIRISGRSATGMTTPASPDGPGPGVADGVGERESGASSVGSKLFPVMNRAALSDCSQVTG